MSWKWSVPTGIGQDVKNEALCQIFWNIPLISVHMGEHKHKYRSAIGQFWPITSTNEYIGQALIKVYFHVVCCSVGWEECVFVVCLRLKLIPDVVVAHSSLFSHTCSKFMVDILKLTWFAYWKCFCVQKQNHDGRMCAVFLKDSAPCE